MSNTSNVVGGGSTSSNSRQCHVCHKLTDLLSCSKCKRTYYCGRECQVADWKSHKAFCKMNVDLATRVSAMHPSLLTWSKKLKRLFKSNAVCTAMSLIAMVSLEVGERTPDEVVVFMADFTRRDAFVTAAAAVDSCDLPQFFPNEPDTLYHLSVQRQYTNETHPHQNNMLGLFIVDTGEEGVPPLCESMPFAVDTETTALLDSLMRGRDAASPDTVVERLIKEGNRAVATAWDTL